MTTTNIGTDVSDDRGNVDNERVRKLIRTISDKSSPLEARDAAKNELLMLHIDWIDRRVRGLSGGKIGISDRSTELLASAYGYLLERASNIATSVQDGGYSLEVVVAQRLAGWAADKIRRSEGQTDKRGKGRKRKPVTVLDDAQDGTALPDDEAIRNEIKAIVFGAVANLNAIEHAVITSHFGLNDGRELTMREVADDLGISLADAHNARRRAQYKLKQWLQNLNPRHSAETGFTNSLENGEPKLS